MNIFKRKYPIRRYSKKSWINGRPVSSYKDSEIMLNVQPQGDNVSFDADGHGVVRSVKAFSDVPLMVADKENGIDADRIFYSGRWYECTQCFCWNNTPLKHYECVLVAVKGESV